MAGFAHVTILAVLATLASCQDDGGAHSPSRKCRNYKCPSYELLETNEEYDVREYDAAMWAGTPGSFMDLFGYIQGNNAEGRKVDMTAPVIREYSMGDGFEMESSSNSMAFFMQEGEAPQPSEGSNIDLVPMPKIKVYVRSFGRWARTSTVKSNLKELVDALTKDGLIDDVNTEEMFLAGYDSPYQFRNRHNEVWLMEKMLQ